VNTYHFDGLVLGDILRLLLQIVDDGGICVAGFCQVLDYLDVRGSYSEVQRGVSLVVFDVNKGFFNLGQNLDNFKASNLASYMQRSFTLLCSSVDIRELFDQQFDHLLIFTFDRIMQRLKILFVLEINIRALILIFNLIE
jgi:hypothetical protein